MKTAAATAATSAYRRIERDTGEAARLPRLTGKTAIVPLDEDAPPRWAAAGSDACRGSIDRRRNVLGRRSGATSADESGGVAVRRADPHRYRSPYRRERACDRRGSGPYSA